MLKQTLLWLGISLALVSVGVARPGYLHHDHHHHLDYPLLHHAEPLHVAKVVHVPAAVSHQSSTVIHTVPHHHVIKPIVVPTVVKTIVHPPPIIKTFHAAPIIKAYHPAPLALHYDPFHHHHHHAFDHHGFDHHHFH